MAFDRIDLSKKNTGPTGSGSRVAGAVPTTAVPPQTPTTGEAAFRVRTQQTSVTVPTAPQVVVKPVMKESKNMNMVSSKVVTLSVIGVLLLGLASGVGAAFVYSSSRPGTAADVQQEATAQDVQNSLVVGAVFGVPDEKTFRDDTEGVLIAGGLEGEGSHTLLRPGGVSQNVYLTSSVVQLDQFEGMRVRVWGETFKGQKAGWLMDVGRVEIKELSAEKPAWYQETVSKGTSGE